MIQLLCFSYLLFFVLSMQLQAKISNDEVVHDSRFTKYSTKDNDNMKSDLKNENVTPHFPRIPLTTVNLRKTCVSHIMRPIHE